MKNRACGGSEKPVRQNVMIRRRRKEVEERRAGSQSPDDAVREGAERQRAGLSLYSEAFE